MKTIARWLAALVAVALAAGCVAASAQREHPSTAWRSGIAVQLWSFHGDLERDVPGTLRRIKALGFDRVETYPIQGLSAGQLRAALDAAGLAAVSAHMPWDRIRTDLDGVIADARVLGVDQFGPGSINLFDGRPFRPMSLAEAEREGAHLRRACAVAGSAGMRVFIHTHGNELGPGGDTAPLDRMLQSAGKCFDIQVDVTWLKWAGVDPAAFIRRYGSRVTSLHVKDIAPEALGRPFGSFGPESFPVLGQGAIDWPEVMQAARASATRHYIIEDESEHPVEQIPRSMEYLDKVELTARAYVDRSKGRA